MKTRALLKIILTAILFVGVVTIITRSKTGSTVTVPDKDFGWKFSVTKFPLTGSGESLAYSDIRDPGGIPQGLPVRLQIPLIGVDSAIEDALITADGRMDVPVGSVNVAWFALGPHPGQKGSAVIGGHFGINKGIPFVFYNLDKLKIGNKIYVVDDKGNTLAFIVRKINSFDRNADSTTVFTSQDGLSHLNLITCEGIWNQVNDSYPERLVVFTDSIPSEGAVVVKTSKATSIATQKPETTPIVTSTEKNATPESSLKSLYATQKDGLITSSFLLSIVVVALKIIWP